jgi:hypothetical protein
LVEALDADAKSAFGELDLGDLVVEIEEGEAGGSADAEAGGADVKLSASAVVGPEFVAGGHGAIDDGGDPVVGAGGVEGNGAVGVADASDASRWIVAVGWSVLARALAQSAQRCEESCGAYHQ